MCASFRVKSSNLVRLHFQCQVDILFTRKVREKIANEIGENTMKITALIGKRIKILRLERGLTQGDIEDATGVSRSHISKKQSGLFCVDGVVGLV